ncbi:hypothetical protein ACEPPN_000337 [Leptodophora sp. 'Broadleaf-Isolate-01']
MPIVSARFRELGTGMPVPGLLVFLTHLVNPNPATSFSATTDITGNIRHWCGHEDASHTPGTVAITVIGESEWQMVVGAPNWNKTAITWCHLNFTIRSSHEDYVESLEWFLGHGLWEVTTGDGDWKWTVEPQTLPQARTGLDDYFRKANAKISAPIAEHSLLEDIQTKVAGSLEKLTSRLEELGTAIELLAQGKVLDAPAEGHNTRVTALPEHDTQGIQTPVSGIAHCQAQSKQAEIQRQTDEHYGPEQAYEVAKELLKLHQGHDRAQQHMAKHQTHFQRLQQFGKPRQTEQCSRQAKKRRRGRKGRGKRWSENVVVL